MSLKLKDIPFETLSESASILEVVFSFDSPLFSTTGDATLLSISSRSSVIIGKGWLSMVSLSPARRSGVE